MVVCEKGELKRDRERGREEGRGRAMWLAMATGGLGRRLEGPLPLCVAETGVKNPCFDCKIAIFSR